MVSAPWIASSIFWSCAWPFETEAAAIASERATNIQIKAIREAQRVFSRAISSGERAIKEDFAFHQAIALATQNNRFVEFLEFSRTLDHSAAKHPFF